MKASDMCKIKALQERNTLNAQCRMISEMDFFELFVYCYTFGHAVIFAFWNIRS